MPRPRLLVISLSSIHRDARVLRQISVVREFGDVTTIGYGPAPEGVEHIQVPDDLPSLPQNLPGVLKLALRRLRSAELASPAVRWAMTALEGRTFDAVIANEARVLPLAHQVSRGAPIWVDLHEWAPEERTQVLSWRLLVAPLMDHMCRRYLPQVAASTTVGDAIAALYEQRYGVRPQLMRNTTSLQQLEPSMVPDDGRIRLVHSGGAVPGRSLETMIDAIKVLPENYTLDLYLVTAADGGKYLRTLRERAGSEPRITFHPAVSPDELPTTLNAYDVGVYWLRPTTKNGELALPNKFFDFVQARLALAIGPSIEMSSLVERFGMGVVSDGFDVDDAVLSLRELTSEKIAGFKEATDAAAPELSFERDADVARGIIRGLLSAR
ncbi:hypothetical protein [Microbacterium sp.]|uniref:hypothetical protein n=1 Tax=Microbacterium sp. TaxID=51671 RepID=UPI003F9BE3E2